MSGMRLTVGVIAQLESPFGDYDQEQHQNVSDYLERIGSRLKLTYGGDMVVLIDTDSRTDYGGPGLVILDADIIEQFQNELLDAGLLIRAGTQKVFVDSWYDGADPPHLDITLEEAGYLSEDI